MGKGGNWERIQNTEDENKYKKTYKTQLFIQEEGILIILKKRGNRVELGSLIENEPIEIYLKNLNLNLMLLVYFFLFQNSAKTYELS